MIIRNGIAGNSAVYGAGLCFCDAAILNNTIVANTSTEGSGLLRCNGLIQNNTIAGNSMTGSPGVGRGLASCGGTMANCIIWGNTAPTGPQVYESRLPTYSCIQSWTGGGEGNIVENPQFVNSTGGDYRLSENSPCIDAGKNEEWTRKALDLGGNLRIWRGKDTWTVDMGAYEYGSFPFQVVGFVEDGGEAEVTWNSRPGDTYTVWSCSDLCGGQWAEETTVASLGESTSWTDPDTTSLSTFYRIEIK